MASEKNITHISVEHELEKLKHENKELKLRISEAETINENWASAYYILLDEMNALKAEMVNNKATQEIPTELTNLDLDEEANEKAARRFYENMNDD